MTVGRTQQNNFKTPSPTLMAFTFTGDPPVVMDTHPSQQQAV